MHRTILTLVILGLSTHTMSAQIIQPIRRTQPIAWTSLAIGLARQGAICDPDTSACWNFDWAPQYRAALEYPLASDASVGVAGTMSRAPILWAQNGPTTNPCTSLSGRCDADVNVTQLLGNLRLGGGRGLHQVVDASAGATMYSNFRTTEGARLGPGKTITDATFGIAVGVGYGLTSRTQFVIMSEWGFILHKREPGSPNNTSRQQAYRVGARVALGEK